MTSAKKYLLLAAILAVLTILSAWFAEDWLYWPFSADSSGFDRLNTAMLITIYVTIPLSVATVGLMVTGLIHLYKDHKNKKSR